MRSVSSHKNLEHTIQYFFNIFPPRGADSILDIGSGVSVPYKGYLQTRCRIYKSLDIRPSKKVDFCLDLIEGTHFKDKEWDWTWCSETLEHIPQKHMKTFVDEVCRISMNIVWTFPLPYLPSFNDDKGHRKVIVDMKSYEKEFKVFDRTTKNGRGIYIFGRKDRKITVDKKGIHQEGYSPDNLTRMKSIF